MVALQKVAAKSLPRDGVGTLWSRMSELGGFPRRVLLQLAVASTLAGIAEAGLLMLLVQLALAASGDEARDLPIVGQLDLPTGAVFAAATTLALLRLALHLYSSHLSAKASTQMTTQLREHVFAAYERANWPRQSAALGGELREVVIGHAKQAGTLTSSVSALVVAGVNFLALFAVSLVVNLVGSLIMVLIAVTLFLLLRPVIGHSRRLGAAQRDAGITYAQQVHEAVSMALEIKVFNVGRPVAERLSRSLDVFARTTYQLSLLNGAYSLIYQTMAVLLIIAGLGLLYGIGLASASMGVVILLLIRSIGYSQGMQSSLQRIATIEPVLEQLQDVITDLDTNALPSKGDPLDEVMSIEVRDVAYIYPGGRRALDGLSFAVARGEVVGIAGPSGAGKSTLMQILLRLRTPTEGTMLINGKSAETYSYPGWYETVAYVPQDCRLVSDTVAENIRWFRPEIDDAAIERAARMAHIHDEVASWEDGYDTQVGEGGGAVSGGQRQRICLARAFAGSPAVMVLDEPTSALDSRSEELVRQTLAEVKGEITVFLIAHRETTLEVCDRVLRLRAGQLEADERPAPAGLRADR